MAADTTLRRSRSQSLLTLNAALGFWSQALDNAIGFLYTPDVCTFVTLSFNNDGEPTLEYPPHNHRPSPTHETIFEARIFTPHVELRWLAAPEDSPDEGAFLGNTVVLIEHDVAVPKEWELLAPYSECSSREGTYLFWGGERNQQLQEKNGWINLFNFRIGDLPIPAPTGAAADFAGISFVEYFAPVDQHGNCAVVAERLKKLAFMSWPA